MHFSSLHSWFHCCVSYYLQCSSSLSQRVKKKCQKTCQNLFQHMYNHKPKSNVPLRKNHKTPDGFHVILCVSDNDDIKTSICIYGAVKADNWNRAELEDFNKVLTNWLTVCRKVVRRNVTIDIIGLICINIQKEVSLGPGSMRLIAKGGQNLKFEQTGSLYKAGQFVQTGIYKLSVWPLYQVKLK